MLDKINFDLLYNFVNKFGSALGFNICYGERLCYGEDKVNGKVYLVESLTDDQIEALMKKSLDEGHDYLRDALKDNELPPYDPNLIY